MFRHVILPSALPIVFTGLQIALAAAFSTVVSAELLAATDGLGWMVISASTFLRNDIIILCILILGGAGHHPGLAAAHHGPPAESIGAGASDAPDGARLGGHPAQHAALAAVWVGITSGGLVRDLFLPGPVDLWDGFMELVQDGYKGRPLLEHVGMSLFRVAAGFLTGAAAGTLLGLGMGYCAAAERAGRPLSSSSCARCRSWPTWCC